MKRSIVSKILVPTVGFILGILLGHFCNAHGELPQAYQTAQSIMSHRHIDGKRKFFTIAFEGSWITTNNSSIDFQSLLPKREPKGFGVLKIKGETILIGKIPMPDFRDAPAIVLKNGTVIQ